MERSDDAVSLEIVPTPTGAGVCALIELGEQRRDLAHELQGQGLAQRELKGALAGLGGRQLAIELGGHVADGLAAIGTPALAVNRRRPT